MALPIAFIPELTGEVAKRFESEARESYQRRVNQSEEEKKAEAAALEKGFSKLRRMLAKSHLGDK